MNIAQLFQIQKRLNDRIKAKHQVEGENLLAEKMLAFLVELGELANETRCFKYWSRQQPSDRDVILEEYVDGLHFILTIGLAYRFTNWSLQETYSYNESMTEQFLQVMNKTNELRKTNKESTYNELVAAFLGLGQQLGFTYEEIERSYLEKNKINHQRQDEGY